MNRVYQLEFSPTSATLLSLEPLLRISFRLGSSNHDLSGLSQAVAYLNTQGEEIVSVIPAGRGATQNDPRFLVVTQLIDGKVSKLVGPMDYLWKIHEE